MPAQTSEMPRPRSSGLGLRRDILNEFLRFEDGAIDFFEVAPEISVSLLVPSLSTRSHWYV